MTRERRPKIECRFCHAFDSDVVGGSWDARDEVYIRRRKCRRCGEIRETVEVDRAALQYLRTPQDLAGTA